MTLQTAVTNIEGQDNLAEIFSIFHDGGIASGHMEGNALLLEVDIRYLAERIHPGFRRFHVRLFDASGVRFSTWPKDPKAASRVLTDLREIFSPELEILEGHPHEGRLKIICNQPSSKVDYCGGELFVHTTFAQVTDEAGKPYSIEELRVLAKGYWEDWAKKNKATQSPLNEP